MASKKAGGSACHACGQLGHLWRDCPQHRDKGRDRGMNATGLGNIKTGAGGKRRGGSGPAAESSGPEAAAARGAYVEHRKRVQRVWPASAPKAQLAHATNMTDVETLFSIVEDEAVRTQLLEISAQQLKLSRMVKEVYLPLGRKMELVTCEFDGGGTVILESDNIMEPEHLSVFNAQCALSARCTRRHSRAPSTWNALSHGARRRFAGLPDKLRRTGVDGTLHRISRTVNPISGECNAVAARIGRVIQGHVEALLGMPHTAGVLQAQKSVLIIGPPNVGKTTVLREFARVLSEDRRHTGEWQQEPAMDANRARHAMWTTPSFPQQLRCSPGARRVYHCVTKTCLVFAVAQASATGWLRLWTRASRSLAPATFRILPSVLVACYRSTRRRISTPR